MIIQSKIFKASKTLSNIPVNSVAGFIKGINKKTINHLFVIIFSIFLC